MAEDALGFNFWGNDPNVNTKLRERIAFQMMQNRRPYPKNIGEGLSAIGDAIGDYGTTRRIEQADLAAQRAAASAVGGGDPGPIAPAAPPVLGSGAPMVTPPMGRSAISVAPGDTEVSDGGYNFLDAQSRYGLKPMPGGMVDPITGATHNPDMQAYLGQMTAREAPGGPSSVSPTGAKGPFQFTRGTGKDYGLVAPGVDERDVPAASARAATKFTEDNAAAFEKANGRPPTMAELAVMHQQGRAGGIGLLAGRPTDPKNLAVNNIPGGASPQAAVSKIKNFYGLPEAPIDPRAAVATALAQQGNPAAAPVQMAFNGPPSQGPAPVPQQITPAPQQAQIAPMPPAQPGPDYITPERAAPPEPKRTPPSKDELRLSNMAAAGNDYVLPALKQLQAQRESDDQRQIEKWKQDLQMHREMQMLSERQKETAAQRALNAQKTQQEIDAGRTPVTRETQGHEQWDPVSKTWVEPPRSGANLDERPNPKLSEYQGKSVKFSGQMLEAAREFGDATALADRTERAKASVPIYGNSLTSDDYRRQANSATRFVLAKLRDESGALIGTPEFIREHEAFFPAPGDTPADIERKTRARQVAVEGMMATAGPGRKVIEHDERKRHAAELERKATEAASKPLGTKEQPVQVNNEAEANALPPGSFGVLNGRRFKIRAN